ncbi:ABC transporter substrate-binding protein SapA [Thalassotalea euphylliae]|uniref:ABC transporter substrate-binding protein SapA n=1 Tax=Thalassotalea euphylliae TaxID=1655234 RepID=UPI00362C9F9B
MKLSQRISFGSILTACVLLTGCEVENQEIAQNSIVYCAEGSPVSFNPQTVTSGTTIDAVANQIYDRLITFNAGDNSIAPALAKSWHVTRDGKMITFYLRKDVAFHTTDYFWPSRNLNADDVVFSFRRILDKENPYHQVSGGRYPFFQNVQFSNSIEEVEKINEYTVRFKLRQANSSFLANLATDYAVILSKEYADNLLAEDKASDIDLLPIGTGPFKLKEYQAGSLLRFYRHDQYWNSPAKIKQLVFDITSSDTGRLTKLLTNECDVIAYPIAQHKITENPNLLLEEVTSFNIGYLGFNTEKPPFDDPLVRRAIAHAINKEAIIEAIYAGQAEVAKSILPKNSWAHDDTITDIEYSPIKARQLLVEAGYDEELSFDIWAMPVQRAYNPNALTMAKIIQADLSQIGVNVDIVTYEWATFLRRVSEGEHQSVLLGWSADHPDPDNFFSPLLSCSSVATGSNRALWCNQEFDSLIELALQTTNVSQRTSLYRQAQNILHEELPILPLAHSKRYQARHKDVKGRLLSSFGGISFAEVSKQ